MPDLVAPLAWDSEFFGVPIGRAAVEGATVDTLEAIEREARAKDLACLYATIDPSRDDSSHLLQQRGYRLVEVALAFGRPAGPFTPKPTASVVRRGTPDDLSGLTEVIARLAPWSRFAADPRFGPEAARRMFHAWVERAARDGEEHMLLVAEDDTGITGLSTNVRSPVPRVDLMGVLVPGSGASSALMGGLIEWADEGPTEAGPCAARNIAVLRYVEHCGFDIVRSRYHFHRWLDEPI